MSENIRITWELFFRQLKAGDLINETHFYFLDEPEGEEHYIGYLPEYEEPYWAGYCDVKDGCDFATAEELVNARIYDGKSLKERWDNIVIIGIEGMCLEDWLKFCQHV
mgnify:CR=1 FL=1